MRKWLLILFIPTALNAQTLPLTQFGGNDSDNSPVMVQDGMTPDSENVSTDDSLGIHPRLGFTQFSTQTSQNNWTYFNSNGTKYIIIRSSNTLRADSGSGSFSITIGTVDPDNPTVASALGDKWFYSGTHGLKYWDSVNVVVVSTSLKFTGLATHKGRLWGIGIPGDERVIYGSKLYNGTNFNLAVFPNDDDPVRLTVQGSLDENLTMLYASFRDLLIWGKPSSFGGIYGSRRSNFSSRSFSETIGTAYPESVQDCDGLLRFLGPRRTIWEFDGSNIRKISEDIDTLMGTVVQGDANQRIWVQTSKSDWDNGTLGRGMSSSDTVGDLTFIASSRFTEDLTDGEITSNPAWTVTPEFYSWSVVGGIMSATHNGIGLMITPFTSNAVGTWKFNGNFTLTGAENGTDFDWVIMSLSNTGSRTTDLGYYLHMTRGPGSDFKSCALINSYTGGTIGSSSTFNTVPITEISITRTSSGSFVITRNGGIEMFTAADTQFTSSTYIQLDYKGTMGAMGISQITFSDPSNDLYVSSFTSQSFNVGSKVTSWGSFNANSDPNGGTISYRLFVDTDSSLNVDNPTTFISSQSIASGSTPSISTGTYIAISAEFTRSVATKTVTLNDFSIRWLEGTTLRVAGGYVNRRYWLGVAISSTSNNRVLVYNRNGKWDKYSGLNMVTGILYNGSFIFGNASGIWQAEFGHSDNGAAITAYYTYKTVAPSGFNIVSSYRDLFLFADNSPASLQTQYFVDGINTAYSLPSYQMNTQDGGQNFYLPFSESSVHQSRTISFKWTVSSTSDWRILGGILDFYPEPVMTAQ